MQRKTCGDQLCSTDGNCTVAKPWYVQKGYVENRDYIGSREKNVM